MTGGNITYKFQSDIELRDINDFDISRGFPSRGEIINYHNSYAHDIINNMRHSMSTYKNYMIFETYDELFGD